MTGAQRRVTLAVCISVGLTFLVSAGLTFLMEPMAQALDLSSSSIEVALATPSAASLVVIFIAGQMADRLGHRRALLMFSVTFLLGGVLVALAQGAVELTLGLALCGGSATGIQIVALALLQASVPDGDAHTSAFTTYGMVYPLSFLAFPVLTAGLLGVVEWRLVPLLWAVAGLAIAGVVSTLVKPAAVRRPMGEWVTPLLAGIALAIGVRCLDAIGSTGLASPVTLGGLIMLALVLTALGVRLRTGRQSSFSFDPIRPAIMRVLLIGVAFVALVGTLTYVVIALEYMYGMTPLEASIAVIPAQAGAVLGAKVLARWAIRRFGIGLAGRHLVLALAISLLPLVAMQAGSPAWYLVACATAFNGLAMAAVTVLNTDVMSRAPEGSSGPVASFRGAASAIGSGAGVVVLGTWITSAVDMSAGYQSVTADQIGQLVVGLRVYGLLGCAIVMLAWLVLLVSGRRAQMLSPGISRG